VWRLQWLLQNVPRKAHQHFDLDLLVATVLCAAIVAAGVTPPFVAITAAAI
jgi:hypothetical protein